MRVHEEENQNTVREKSGEADGVPAACESGAEEEQWNKDWWISEAEVCLGSRSLSLRFLVGFAGQFQPL